MEDIISSIFPQKGLVKSILTKKEAQIEGAAYYFKEIMNKDKNIEIFDKI